MAGSLGGLGKTVVGGIGAGLGALGTGLYNFGKRLFGGTTGGAIGDNLANTQNSNQQQQEDQRLDVEPVDVTPNVTPIQQLNMASSGLISPMSPGGTPEEKLDYIIFSIDSMRRSVATLVSSVRSLATGQATVNRNVAAVSEANKPSFFATTIRQGIKQGGLGLLAALVGGSAAGILAGLSYLSGDSKEALSNIGPAINEIKTGTVSPEDSKLYKATEQVVGNWNAGQNVGDVASIETAMESDPAIGILVEGLRNNGVNVDTSAPVNTLLETVKNIQAAEKQKDTQSPTIETPQGQTPAPQVETGDDSTTSTNLTTPSAPETNQTVLENSTAAPSSISSPAAPPSSNGADIEDKPEGETREDEIRLSPQSSINDILQDQQQEQILASTRNIRDRSMETAGGTKTVVTPVVVNNSQAPSQPQMSQVAGGRDRGATLVVAYRTPADARTYSQDNFASV